MNIPRLLPLLAALVPLLASCFNDRLEPVAPTWDVDLTIPLANREYTMLSVVEKQPSLTTEGPGGTQIIYHSSMSTPATVVGDKITLTVDPSVRSVKVGVFGLAAESLAVPIQIPGFPPGATLPFLPDTTVAMPDVHDTIATFRVATLESGSVTMTFRNNMPDTVVIENDIVLSDSVQQIATFSFANTRLWQNQSASRTASLAGKTVCRIVSLSNIVVHIVGRPGPVTLPSGPMLRASVSTSSLRARSASVAFIPPQRLTDNDTTFLALSDSTIVKEVLFKQGTLRMDFASRAPVALTMIYRLPEVLRPAGGGTPYSDSLSLAAFDTGSSTIPLAGIRIRSQDGDLIRSLEAVSSLALPGSLTPVTLNDTDKVIITLSSIGSVMADSASAVIKPTRIDVRRAVALDLAEFSSKFGGQFAIPKAGLHLDALSTIGFPMDLNLRVTARNTTTGTTVVLDIPPSQRRVLPGTSVIVFDSAAVGTFLSALSPKLPDSVRVVGNVLVNPPDAYNPTLAGVGTVASSSFVQDTVTMDVPLRLSLTGGVFRDTVEMTELSDHKDQLDQTNSGTMVVEIQNAIALQAGVQLFFLDSTGTRVLFRLLQNGQPIPVPPATVDAQGNVGAPTPSTTTIVMSTADIRAMTPAKRLACSISLATTPGGPVSVRTSDYIAIRLWSKLSYRVSK